MTETITSSCDGHSRKDKRETNIDLRHLRLLLDLVIQPDKRPSRMIRSPSRRGPHDQLFPFLDLLAPFLSLLRHLASSAHDGFLEPLGIVPSGGGEVGISFVRVLDERLTGTSKVDRARAIMNILEDAIKTT